MKIPNIKALNPEEIAVGFCVGLASAVKIGYWSLPLAVLTAYLWAAGGAKGEEGGNKAYRRFGVPTAWVLAVMTITQNHWTLAAWLPAHGVTRIGYGIPTTQPVDAGSFLGRFFYSVISDGMEITARQHLATILTRATTYLLLAFSLFCVPTFMHWIFIK